MGGLLKTCSSRHAAELSRLGWTVDYQFFAGEDQQPYEIGLLWERSGEPVYPSKNTDRWLTPEGEPPLISRRLKRH